MKTLLKEHAALNEFYEKLQDTCISIKRYYLLIDKTKIRKIETFMSISSSLKCVHEIWNNLSNSSRNLTKKKKKKNLYTHIYINIFS
jgi:hypothetical protein